MPTMLAQNIRALRQHLGMKQGAFADEVGAQQSNISRWEGKGMVPETSALEAMSRLAGMTISEFRSKRWEPQQGKATSIAGPIGEADGDTVEIQHLDLAFGLGGTFTDSGPTEFEVLPFPRPWVETITRSPPELLTWTRGRGESMRPTIDDGDLVLLDRSQRDVREQDAMWAFTIGDVASIKRLRVKGDRFQIFSDNPSVTPDEEPIDFVNIVARVVFVGRRV